jgi:hypothetical protein
MLRVILLLLISFVSLLAEDDYEIKSLRVYQKGNEISFPISMFGSKITIEFDVKSGSEPSWEILFLLCDKDWEPYESNLLMDEMYNTQRNLWFDILPFHSERANYHYAESFPNKNVRFPFSGKWIFFIRDTFDHEIIYGEGKFYVVNDIATNLMVSLTDERLEGRNPVPATFGEVFNLKVTAKLSDSLFTERIEEVEVIENKKIEFPIVIDKTYDNEYRFYEIDDVNQLSFFAKDIQPGGAYRQVNLMSRTKHTPPKTKAQFTGIEISHKFSPGGRDYFGGAKLMNFKKDYAEYMDVEFSIRPPEGYYENIFLVGSFSDWDIWSEYEMKNKDGLFTSTIELKRGIYDYQYVVADINNNYIESVDWLELEGNSWSTRREYYIFLFYETEELGGYDKIIAFKNIRSK